MTTILLSFYLYTKRYPKVFTYAILIVYLWIEITFLVANMKKFAHGGWLTLLIGLLLITTMYVWQAGRKLKAKYKKYLPLDGYIPAIKKLSNDKTVPKFATHLVYLTFSDSPGLIEQRIIESIFFQQPKRADIYWLIHVEVDDAPYTMSYSTKIHAPEDLISVRFKLGFRIVPRLNLYFRKIVTGMIDHKEITIKNNYCMIDHYEACGDYRFVVMKSFLSFDNQLPFWKNQMMRFYFLLDKISLPDPEAFGLDYNNVVVERVPLVVQGTDNIQLERES
jgi:KUP system potassium uptake protein